MLGGVNMKQVELPFGTQVKYFTAYRYELQQEIRSLEEKDGVISNQIKRNHFKRDKILHKFKIWELVLSHSIAAGIGLGILLVLFTILPLPLVLFLGSVDLYLFGYEIPLVMLGGMDRIIEKFPSIIQLEKDLNILIDQQEENHQSHFVIRGELKKVESELKRYYEAREKFRPLEKEQKPSLESPTYDRGVKSRTDHLIQNVA